MPSPIDLMCRPYNTGQWSHYRVRKLLRFFVLILPGDAHVCTVVVYAGLAVVVLATIIMSVTDLTALFQSTCIIIVNKLSVYDSV